MYMKSLRSSQGNAGAGSALGYCRFAIELCIWKALEAKKDTYSMEI